MNPNLIEAQVREILNSRLALAPESNHGDSSSSAEDISEPSAPVPISFVCGDILIVRNSFVEMRSQKNEHQTAFDAGLRLRVAGIDNMGNICVNTVDQRWKQEKWITTRNFFNLQKKNSQIKMTRPASRGHSRSLTFDSSAPRLYSEEEMRTPRSPDFSENLRMGPSAHSRHRSMDVNASFDTPERPQRKQGHRRTMSNKDELRERIRRAIARRESVDMRNGFPFNSGVNSTSQSQTVEESTNSEAGRFDRKVMPPKVKMPSNPDLDRVRQREDARTPEAVSRNSVPPDSISCPTPRNAWADPSTPRVSSFSEARHVPIHSPPRSASFQGDIPKQKTQKPGPSRRRKSSVVFCDCDGVLNTAYTPVGEDGLPLDAILVDRVAKLCKETRANLVLTSTWREDQVAYGKLFRTFQSRGITVLGRTPSLGSRSAEILAWLRHNQRHVRNWVILDDRMELFKEKYNLICPHLVLVDEDTGVTEQDLDYAKTILNPNPVPAVRRKRIGNVDVKSNSESAI